MRHWTLLLALAAMPAARATAPAPAPSPPATGRVPGLSVTPPAVPPPVLTMPNGPYLAVPVPSPGLQKDLDELRRQHPEIKDLNDVLKMNPKPDDVQEFLRRHPVLPLPPDMTLRFAPAPTDRTLLVYRDSDRQLFKKEHPLLTPDVPVRIAPLQQGVQPLVPVTGAPPRK